MRLTVVLALLKKEFLNIIRDRKSFIVMVLLPLLMFPLLIGVMSIILTSFTHMDPTITFGVNYEVTEDFKKYVNDYYDDTKVEIIYHDENKLKEMFDAGELGVYVLKDNNTYEIHYDENDTGNISSSIAIEEIYAEYQEKYINDSLKELNIDYEELKKSFEIQFVQESVTEMGTFVPSIISMALVMIISSVAFSVAIDVTTSEKEKGTLETLLSLPVKKTELVTSKFITVFLLSTMSGVLTYISLFGTMFFASNTLKLLGVTGLSFGIDVLLIYLVSIILISLLFSGVLLSVTIFSKNLKEAQNSLYPLEIFVSFISMLPMFGVSSSLKLSLVPFVNISLLFNGALSSNIDILFVVLTFASSIIYSILLIILISKIYNQEEVLFNTKSLSNISFKNGKKKVNNFSVMTSLLISVIIYILAMYFTIVFIGLGKYVLLAVMPVTMILIVVIAGLISNLDFKNALKIKRFNIKRMIMCIMLYMAGYILSNFIVNFISLVFPSIVSDYSAVVDVLTIDNILLGLLFTAVLPALAEEILFRGVLLNSFNKKWGKFVAILASSLVFGIYHMNWLQGIFAFLLGLILGYSYLMTGSLWVPIIIHFINNAIAVLATHYSILDFSLSPIIWAVILLICIIMVIFVIYWFEIKGNERVSS